MLRKCEVVKVIETLNAIVPTENVQAVLHDLASMAETTRRCLESSLLVLLLSCALVLRLVRIRVVRRILRLNCTPEFFIDLVLIEIAPWIASAASEQVDGVAMSEKDMAVAG